MKQTTDDNHYIPVWKLLTRRKATAQSLCHCLGITAGWPSDVRTIFLAQQGHCDATLRALYDCRKSLRSFLGQNANLKLCVALTTTVPCLYGITRRHCDVSMGLRFFQICHCAGLNKIVEAMMPVNLYDDCKVSLRRPHRNGDWTLHGHRIIVVRQM